MGVIEYEVVPFYNLLRLLLDRHGMFGIENLGDLFIYIEGYKMAVLSREIFDEDLRHFESFNDFVIDRLNGGSSMNWSSIILEHESNKEASFELFKKLLCDFQNK